RVSSVAELLQIQQDISAKLNHALNSDENIEQLEKEIEKERASLITLAQKISENRKKSFPVIEKHVADVLKEVGMPNAQLKVDHHTRSENEFDANGLDQIRFLFTANKGHQLNELQKVASGGELSRLMLSIKSLIAEKTALPTIIFDEIDTGVSGEVAHRV